MASKDELASFVLKNVEGLEEATKQQPDSSGAYGVLYRVTVDGMPCIAKRLHAILTKEVLKTEKASIQKKFRQECVLLSQLRHPNVVHFVGVCTGSTEDDLSLIMERLHSDLDKYLELQPNIPLHRKLSILVDTSHGLLYLHSKGIIHRDLTAPNILLTRCLQAKIADLGVSKLLPTRAIAKHTKVPGQASYMPPEAMHENAKYDSKLDIFSFGHLSTFVASQEFPEVFDVDMRKPENLTHVHNGTLQMLRRQKALKAVGLTHCLYPLITECLLDEPKLRPTTEALNRRLIELASKHCSDHEDFVAEVLEDNRQLGATVHAQQLQFQQLKTNFERALSEAQRELRELKTNPPMTAAASAPSQVETADKGDDVHIDPFESNRRHIRSRTVQFALASTGNGDSQAHAQTPPESHTERDAAAHNQRMMESLRRHVQLLKAELRRKKEECAILQQSHEEHIQLLASQSQCDKLNFLSDLKTAKRRGDVAARQLKQLQGQWAAEKDMLGKMQGNCADLHQQNQQLRGDLARLRSEPALSSLHVPQASVHHEHRPSEDTSHVPSSALPQAPLSQRDHPPSTSSRRPPLSQQRQQPSDTRTSHHPLQISSQALRRKTRTDSHTLTGSSPQDFSNNL